MGMAHMGPMVNSAKKNPADRQASDTYKLCVNISGTSDTKVKNMQTQTM